MNEANNSTFSILNDEVTKQEFPMSNTQNRIA